MLSFKRRSLLELRNSEMWRGEVRETATEVSEEVAASTLKEYLLTPCSRVLLEKLTGSAASQEIPRLFGTRWFLTVPTSARHMSLSWANSIKSPQFPPTPWRSILNYPPIYVWVSPMVSFPQVSQPEPCAHLSPPPYAPHAPPISFFSILLPA